MVDPNPANLSRESRRILNEPEFGNVCSSDNTATISPAISKPTACGSERRNGHSKLVYDKATRTIVSIDPHPTPSPAPRFVDDVTEMALAAYDDVYTAEYTTTGATDNKTIAMRAAVETVIAICAMDAEAEQRGGVREQVSLIDNFLVIRVPIDALSVAATLAWGKHAGRDLTVTDLPAFANELLRELRKERENGDTLVTDMLDAAVVRAIEDGAEGAEIAVI